MNQISTPKRRRAPRLKDSRKHEVKTTSFAQIKNKKVRATVMAISGKDIRRVQIISPEEAIVYNHRNWRKR